MTDKPIKFTCKINFHSWQYQTKIAVYKKNDNVIREKEEIYQRTCLHCGRIERNIGTYNKWLRVVGENGN